MPEPELSACGDYSCASGALGEEGAGAGAAPASRASIALISAIVPGDAGGALAGPVAELDLGPADTAGGRSVTLVMSNDIAQLHG